MTEHPRDAEAIFLAALDKATPHERAEYVEASCAGISSFCGAYVSFWAATRGQEGRSMRRLPGSGVPWTCQR